MKDSRRPWCRGSQSGWETRCQSAHARRRREVGADVERPNQSRVSRRSSRRSQARGCSLQARNRNTMQSLVRPGEAYIPPSSIGRPKVRDQRKAPAETVAMRRCQVRDETQSGESSPAVCARSCQARSRSDREESSYGGRPYANRQRKHTCNFKEGGACKVLEPEFLYLPIPAPFFVLI